MTFLGPNDRFNRLTRWTPEIEAEAKKAKAEGRFYEWSSLRSDMKTYEEAVLFDGAVDMPQFHELPKERRDAIRRERLRFAQAMHKFGSSLRNDCS